MGDTEGDTVLFVRPDGSPMAFYVSRGLLNRDALVDEITVREVFYEKNGSSCLTIGSLIT
jgi:hypothetical protein